MKPNLFNIATKELSQDAFIAWLLRWADDSFMEENQSLCTAGKEFVKKLLSFKYQIKIDDIKDVDISRQWEHIDIIAHVTIENENNGYVIVIEDKVNTSEHDDQLERYAEFIEAVNERYRAKHKVVFIYLKTGLETADNIKKIRNKDWNYISRKDFLDFLQSQNPQSEIYDEYLSNLIEKQKKSDSFTEYWCLGSWDATQGLYSYIEERLGNEWSHWDYVPNASGGFLGLWFHFTPVASNEKCELYLQIENKFGDNASGIPNLFIKICGEWDRNIDTLYNIFGVINDSSKKTDLTISKPLRYRIGEYTSVAIIDDVFVGKENGDLDLENLMKKLNNAIEFIDTVTGLL